MMIFLIDNAHHPIIKYKNMTLDLNSFNFTDNQIRYI